MEQIQVVPIRPTRLPDWLRRPIQTDKSYGETHSALKKMDCIPYARKQNVQIVMSVGIMVPLP